MKKVLVVRFSSFGDIVQSTAALPLLKGMEVHWLTRSAFSELLEAHPQIQKLWSYSSKTGLLGLLSFFFVLRKEKYDLVYDAHNNLRSFLLRLLFLCFAPRTKWVQRPKSRWKRHLFFKWKRRDILPQPLVGAKSFTEPLKKALNLQQTTEETKNLYLKESDSDLFSQWPKQYIVIAPSAAWPNKRWPLQHWKCLLQKPLPLPVLLLGGPNDHFCEELKEQSATENQVINLAGQLSLLQSSLVVQKAQIVISADTGLMHVADQSLTPSLCLIGPTAFGYPLNSTSKVLEVQLPCKPCSKDGRTPCTNAIHQKCMVDITPERVHESLTRLLQEAR